MLHQNDLIFCKTESGVTSCGYNISNMLLKNTLQMSGQNLQYSNVGKMGKMGKMGNTGKDDIRIAKLMEDLVVPSGLFYCHPMTKHKVFNYKPTQSPQSPREKGDNNEINIVNGMLDESVYDKLLSLVSMDKKKLFDRKTRKNKGAIFQKIKDSSMASDVDMDGDGDGDGDVDVSKAEKREKGEKREKLNKKKSLKININTQKPQENQQENQKPNQRKTKKVRFADF
jgi:hypothetical protein